MAEEVVGVVGGFDGGEAGEVGAVDGGGALLLAGVEIVDVGGWAAEGLDGVPAFADPGDAFVVVGGIGPIADDDDRVGGGALGEGGGVGWDLGDVAAELFDGEIDAFLVGGDDAAACGRGWRR